MPFISGKFPIKIQDLKVTNHSKKQIDYFNRNLEELEAPTSIRDRLCHVPVTFYLNNTNDDKIISPHIIFT